MVNTLINKVFKEDIMRREPVINKRMKQSKSDKIILYGLIGVAVLAVIVFALLMYSKSLNDDVRNSTMTLEQMASRNEDEATDETQTTGTEIGKTVEEMEDENSQSISSSTNISNVVNSTNTTNTNSNLNSNNSNTANNTSDTTNNSNTTQNNQSSANITNEKSDENRQNATTELSFQKPVEGDVVREFAKDNLIYSPTLEEWVTHTGIDIKADKTTVVKSAEVGTVKSIKNDPRYGLTVVIEHANGFSSVYSNLLTAEFVEEGENVKKGQTIATVGNTATFEIADESHLHFEILKDSKYVDPELYIK